MIMMIRRWGSDAFMKYIQNRLKNLLSTWRQKMLMMQHFCHTPSATNSPSKKIEYGGLAGLMLENRCRWGRHHFG
jgi:hypothetical protein